MTPTISRPTVHYAPEMAATCRPADRLEWETAGGRPVASMLIDAITYGDHVRCLEHHGRPLAIWGVNGLPQQRGCGQLWFLASTAASRFVHRLHRSWVEELAIMHARWPFLIGWTLAGNELHHQWLKSRGFLAHTVAQRGPSAATYIAFVHHKDWT